MGPITLIARYREIERDQRRLYREALWQLTIAVVRIRSRSFSSLVRHLQREDLFAAPPPAGAREIEQASELGRIVARVARNLPGKPACLPQVLALQVMMERRGFPGALYLGARPAAGTSEADRGAGDGLVAHAWVSCGGVIVNGGERSPSLYPELVTFRWE